MLLVQKCRSKNEQIGAKIRNTFPFLKTINFTVINVIRYQLKPIKCSFISTWEAIATCHYQIFTKRQKSNNL